ncbi:MAG: type II secretion system protein GspL [Gammaproteobacteria bacterium]|nr:type II secretion system protein GspL [Gammaproteobacteria bacterium]
MADTLLIHYRPCDAQQACWSFVDDKGNSTTKLGRGPLTDIGPLAKGRRATVLIDSSCLNLETVQVPSNNRQRQLQAIPFALEDKLAADIEDTHFALGKKQADENIPVITINKQLLEQVLDDFKQAGIFVEYLAADVLALPIEHNNWCVLFDGDSALIKTGRYTGHYCDRDNLPIVLATLLKQAVQQPESILLYHHADDIQATEPLADIDIGLSIRSYEQHPLSVFAQNFTSAQQLNILQGDYTAKREGSALLKPWKTVAALAAGWIILQLIYAGIEGKQLSIKNQQLTAQIENEFKRVNPGTRKFNNMRKRMERKLTELRGGGNDDEQTFLLLLSHASPAISSNKKVSIAAMAYRNKYIDMELQADSLQSLEAIKNQLASIRGIKTVLSTSVEKDKVSGRLRLEKQG